jgi:phage gp36-like protein
MAYCTEQEIINLCVSKEALIRLTDDSKVNEVDSAKVDAAIKAASAEIDKYLTGRYTVPFADGSVPDLVNMWCCYLATYFLHRAQTSIPRSVQANRDLAVKNLRAVMEGDVAVPGAEDSLDSAGLPSSTTIGKGHQFINDQYDTDGNVTEPGNMGSGGRW